MDDTVVTDKTRVPLNMAMAHFLSGRVDSLSYFFLLLCTICQPYGDIPVDCLAKEIGLKSVCLYGHKELSPYFSNPCFNSMICCEIM